MNRSGCALRRALILLLAASAMTGCMTVTMTRGAVTCVARAASREVPGEDERRFDLTGLAAELSMVLLTLPAWLGVGLLFDAVTSPYQALVATVDPVGYWKGLTGDWELVRAGPCPR